MLALWKRRAPTSPEIGADVLGAPRCRSGPNWCLEGPPPSPIAIGGPFPQAKALPSPPSPSLFPPPPLALFALLRNREARSGVGGGVLGCRGGWRGGPSAVLGARPTSGGTRILKTSLTTPPPPIGRPSMEAFFGHPREPLSGY